MLKMFLIYSERLGRHLKKVWLGLNNSLRLVEMGFKL